MNEEKDLNGQRQITRRQFLAGAAALVAVAAVAVVGLSPREAEAPSTPPEISQVGSVSQDTVAQGCQLVQTLRYTPCDHEVTRRLEAPTELIGKGRGDVEAAYDQWRVTSFAAQEITMEQQLDIYCAQHMVLMPDETGVLGILKTSTAMPWRSFALWKRSWQPCRTQPRRKFAWARVSTAFKTLNNGWKV
ncbi:MAG: twin-arginine translocation signal domain-containing protein [Clostridia bacterium]|nr:twin-arginine translocation signal domain-containing protein [Clostridia bacterium]